MRPCARLVSSGSSGAGAVGFLRRVVAVRMIGCTHIWQWSERVEDGSREPQVACMSWTDVLTEVAAW